MLCFQKQTVVFQTKILFSKQSFCSLVMVIWLCTGMRVFCFEEFCFVSETKFSFRNFYLPLGGIKSKKIDIRLQNQDFVYETKILFRKKKKNLLKKIFHLCIFNDNCSNAGFLFEGGENGALLPLEKNLPLKKSVNNRCVYKTFAPPPLSIFLWLQICETRQENLSPKQNFVSKAIPFVSVLFWKQTFVSFLF